MDPSGGVSPQSRRPGDAMSISSLLSNDGLSQALSPPTDSLVPSIQPVVSPTQAFHTLAQDQTQSYPTALAISSSIKTIPSTSSMSPLPAKSAISQKMSLSQITSENNDNDNDDDNTDEQNDNELVSINNMTDSHSDSDPGSPLFLGLATAASLDPASDSAPSQLQSLYKTASKSLYSSDKQNYVNDLQSKFLRTVDLDAHYQLDHRISMQRKLLEKYTFRAQAFKRYAHRALHDAAVAKVLYQEELQEKEEKAAATKVKSEISKNKKKPSAQSTEDVSTATPPVKKSRRQAAKRAEKKEKEEDAKKLAAEASKTADASSPLTAPHGKKVDSRKDGKKSVRSGHKNANGTKHEKDGSSAGNGGNVAIAIKVDPSQEGVDSGATVNDATHGAPNQEGLDGLTSEEHNHPKLPKLILKAPSLKEIKALARLYQITYDGIWKDMARKDSSRVYRMIQTAGNVKQSNAKKTAVLAAKEARRWQYRTNKNIKDLQGRAKRAMREMLGFWKRNEREERDLRRKAEKEAVEQAKKEEEAREAKRQSRKLNFLITQTELYSHFIGRKIKGDGGDDSTDQIAQTTAVEDLDFDNADDEELHQAAANNAQTAVLDAQKRARNFNSSSLEMDSEEMNFQNPTSLGDIQIPQPKMLTCQLKEYQVKGLSWLANLYEQGINGILADEMGLGKTVQSISVMAYLAETHNIWGPFLVIAPASTLHNWQQEIARFVPEFKALPYWGNGKDRKILRKFWDRKQVTYTRDSPFHVLITSYQLIVADAQYFQRIKWQYMILDEAQAIKSSSSTRWKSLLSFQCRNRLLLTGTPIQNSMQELWALLHFIMPSLFDSHDEFSEWFSKDIESHAQSNTQLNEQQLKRLHMILKPFMLRRIKKHVQQELGDKIEIDVYCELTTRQRLMYRTLRSQISLIDLIEKATSGSDDGTQSLMNLVMQFRKVCNHPDLFERADVKSAFSFANFGKTASLARDGPVIEFGYSAENPINLQIPKLLYRNGGFLDIPNAGSPAGFQQKFLDNMLNIWNSEHISQSDAFSGWLSLCNISASQAARIGRTGIFERALKDVFNARENSALENSMDSLQFVYSSPHRLASKATDGVLRELVTVYKRLPVDNYYDVLDPAFDDRVLSPPISLIGSDRGIVVDQHRLLFSPQVKSALFPMTLDQEWDLVSRCKVSPASFPPSNLLPSLKNRSSTIRMPSMSKFVTDSGKLSRLDQLLAELKANDHRVLIYFQMTKMMDLMEEYLTFRQYKYCRLDGSSKLSDRRDLVNDWQTKPELFVFLLSTRAGGLGINLTAADTVIFYDSDWNPTIDSQAMDRAHRLGQTKQVTVYRLLVKGTIEERMRDRAKQKEHVQQVVMEGKSSAPGEHAQAEGDNGALAATGVDFQKPGREVAYWLLDDDEAANAALSQRVQAAEQRNNNAGPFKGKGFGTKRASTFTGNSPIEPSAKKVKSEKNSKPLSLEEMYHEDEGNFDEMSARTSEAPTPGTMTPVEPIRQHKKTGSRGHRRMSEHRVER